MACGRGTPTPSGGRGRLVVIERIGDGFTALQAQLGLAAAAPVISRMGALDIVPYRHQAPGEMDGEGGTGNPLAWVSKTGLPTVPPASRKPSCGGWWTPTSLLSLAALTRRRFVFARQPQSAGHDGHQDVMVTGHGTN